MNLLISDSSLRVIVPNDKNFEVNGGLVGVERDILIKLSSYIDDIGTVRSV
jgi:hypothetical protein